MKRLIVNADDFGLSESINEGILESHTRGIVTAATWMANGHAAEEAASLAPETLDVGLHLALHDVPPMSDPEPFVGLLTRDGRFPSDHWSVAMWTLRNPRARAIVRNEWLAQLAAFETTFSHPPTHIDSHKHIALFPSLQDLMVETAARARGARVRTPVEVSSRPSSFVLSALGRRLRERLNETNLPATDAFLGYRESGRLTSPRLHALLTRVRPGLTELMVHPGAHDEPGGYRRRAETIALTSDETRRRIDALGILLVSTSGVA